MVKKHSMTIQCTKEVLQIEDLFKVLMCDQQSPAFFLKRDIYWEGTYIFLFIAGIVSYYLYIHSEDIRIDGYSTGNH